MNLTAEEKEIIRAFGGLYSGGHAQRLRDSGQPNAMPPWTDWLGKQVVKCPIDLWLYQEVIFETKPDLLIETGTSGSGSAFFFATLFDLIGHGHVLTMDKDSYPHLEVTHPRITYLVGDSVSPEMIVRVRDFQGARPGARTMLSMDYEHVAAELAAYAALVSPGCYCVVEDVHYSEGEGGGDPAWGSLAVHEFQAREPQLFQRDLSRERHFITSNVWLRRR